MVRMALVVCVVVAAGGCGGMTSSKEIPQTIGGDLHMAAASGGVASIERLLASGRQVDEQNTFGETPLFAAVAFGERRTASYLVTQGADVNAASEAGITALHVAAMKNYVDIAKVLLDHGASVQPASCQRTPLHLARSAEMAELLVRRGADMTVRDEEGLTVYQRARENGYEGVIAFLESRGVVR